MVYECKYIQERGEIKVKRIVLLKCSCKFAFSSGHKQSFLAAITRFNDQPLSFNRWFTRSVVVYVDFNAAWNGWGPVYKEVG